MKEEQGNGRAAGCSLGIGMAVILAMLAFALCGCKTRYVTTTEYKEVPVTIHDTLRQYTLAHDTTIIKDSVVVTTKGDTIYEQRWRDRWRTSVRVDTVTQIVEKPVTVTQTKTEHKEVEKQSSWWSNLALRALACLLVVVCALLLVERIKKK